MGKPHLYNFPTISDMGESSKAMCKPHPYNFQLPSWLIFSRYKFNLRLILIGWCHGLRFCLTCDNFGHDFTDSDFERLSTLMLFHHKMQPINFWIWTYVRRSSCKAIWIIHLLRSTMFHMRTPYCRMRTHGHYGKSATIWITSVMIGNWLQEFGEDMMGQHV